MLRVRSSSKGIAALSAIALLTLVAGCDAGRNGNGAAGAQPAAQATTAPVANGSTASGTPAQAAGQAAAPTTAPSTPAAAPTSPAAPTSAVRTAAAQAPAQSG